MLKVETEGATVETHSAGDRQVCRQKFRGKYEVKKKTKNNNPRLSQ